MPCKVFRFGLFFDGTGNNKSYAKEKGNGSESNIAKLNKHYQEGDFDA